MSWPFSGLFTGRRRELERLRSLATDSAVHVVLLVGTPGVGKRRLAAEALARLGPGVAVVRAVGTEASRQVPFGAFTHLLPIRSAAQGPNHTERPGPVGLLGWATESIIHAAGGRPLAVCAEDAHLFDPASAALVRQLATTPGAFVLLTAPPQAEQEAQQPWWRELAPLRLELAPLPERAIGRLAEAALDRPVPAAEAARLHTVTGGNPLHLHELLACGGTGEELDAAVLIRLGGLGAGVRRVLELVAFGEPVGVGVLTLLAGPDELAAAGESGMVELAGGGGRAYARLCHQAHGRVLRADTDPAVAALRCEELAGAVQRLGARRREDPLRMAVWRLDGGVPGAPGPLVTACRLAWAAHDYRLAIRLGEAAVAAGGGVAAAVALANVLMNVNRHEEGEAALQAVWDRALDERERMALTSVRAGLLFGMDRVADAGRLLEETERSLRCPMMRRELRVARGNLVTLAGHCRSGRAIMEELLLADDLTPPVAAQARTFRALALAHSGRAAEALAEAEAVAAEPACWRDEAPFLDPILALTRYTALLHLGDPAEAGRVVQEVRGRGDLDLWPPASIIFRAAEAALARLGGRVAEAMEIAGDRGGDVRLAMPCLAERAHAAALAGDLPAARAALAAGRDPASFFGLLRHGMDLARAWVVARSEEGAGRAVELAQLAADRARVENLYGLELFALHDVVRLGAPERVAARLAELAGHVDGALAPLFAAHARARAAGDAAALAEIADRFSELGLELYAAETRDQARRNARLTSSATSTP